MAYALLKIPKPSTSHLEKVFRAIFGSLSVIKMNHIYTKKNEVFDSFSVIVRRQEGSWYCFTERNVLAFFIDYITFSALIDYMKNQKSQSSSTAVSNLLCRSSWASTFQLVRLLMQIDEADLGFWVKSF